MQVRVANAQAWSSSFQVQYSILAETCAPSGEDEYIPLAGKAGDVSVIPPDVRVQDVINQLEGR